MVKRMNDLKATPVLKWAGGKTQLKRFIVDEINKVIEEDSTYYEPFFGGGAIFFELFPKKAVLNDLNKDLVNTYQAIRNTPFKLMSLLDEHKANDSDTYYYIIRNQDRTVEFKKQKYYLKAARTIYLNKTCYNGLYRVNSQGYFNTPRGRYNNPLIYNRDNIIMISNHFRNHDIIIMNKDYKLVIQNAVAGDIIYLDPPYDYEDESKGFTKYTPKGFTRDNLRELKQVCDILIKKGCKIFISNNNTSYVQSLFQNEPNYKLYYAHTILKANRNINSIGNSRKKVDEVLIYGSNDISASR